MAVPMEPATPCCVLEKMKLAEMYVSAILIYSYERRRPPMIESIAKRRKVEQSIICTNDRETAFPTKDPVFWDRVRIISLFSPLQNVCAVDMSRMHSIYM